LLLTYRVTVYTHVSRLQLINLIECKAIEWGPCTANEIKAKLSRSRVGPLQKYDW